MKIHEYQAKALLAKYGVPVPQGEVVFNADDACRRGPRASAAAPSSSRRRIHAGGRGKGGGVKVVKGPEEARAAAAQDHRMNLVTYQTGPGRAEGCSGC
jgi:succinyl-CoA synthetase beta subunit